MKSTLTAAEFNALAAESPIRAEYAAASDGSYVLTLDGVMPREIQVARTTKAEADRLKAEADELKTKLAAAEQANADRTPPDWKTRVEAMDQRLKAAENREKDTNARLASERFRNAASAVALASKVRPEAVVDVLARAQTAGFKLTDSLTVETAPDSTTGQVTTMQAWLDAQRTQHAFLFLPSEGSGHQGGNGTPAGGAVDRRASIDIDDHTFGDPAALGAYAAARLAAKTAGQT